MLRSKKDQRKLCTLAETKYTHIPSRAKDELEGVSSPPTDQRGDASSKGAPLCHFSTSHVTTLNWKSLHGHVSIFNGHSHTPTAKLFLSWTAVMWHLTWRWALLWTSCVQWTNYPDLVWSPGRGEVITWGA